VSGTSGGGGAPTDAEYVVMSADATLTDERVLTAGADIDIADGGAGGNATVSVSTGTFARVPHGHSASQISDVYAHDVAIYEDHVFQATGTIIDFTGNMNVAVTGTSVFVSSTGGGGGGSTILIYEDGAFQVTGSAINFESQLEVHVTGSTAHIKIPDNTFSEPGHTHFSSSITDLQHAIPIYEDGVFQATGTIIDFGENVNVAVTGSVVFVSTTDTQGGGGGGDLLIYDDSVFKVTGTALSFDTNLEIHVTGSIAYINSNAAGGAGGFPAIYDDSVFKNTGVAISFDEGLEVVSTGTTAYVSYEDIGARIYNSTAITISHNTSTVVTFDSERWDTDNIHSGSSTGQLWCNTPGSYLIFGSFAWETDTVSFSQIGIRLNGSTFIAVNRMPNHGGIGPIWEISTVYKLSVGDYIEAIAFQTTTADLDILASANYGCEFGMQRIG
jgi:hypothetical protein